MTGLSLFGCGAVGALVKDILVDNKIKLPKIVEGELVLGFIGAVVIGGFVGFFVDHSLLTAFFAGYSGFSALEALLPKKGTNGQTEISAEPAEIQKKNSDGNFTIRPPFQNKYPLTQKFGENPAWYKASGFNGHPGLDWGLPWGTPVLACDHGAVLEAGQNSGNGFFVRLQHSWGQSLCCHLKAQACVAVGVAVDRGETIGFSGNTGAVRPAPTAAQPRAGAHLHFGIKINGVSNLGYKDYVDPTPFLETV